ncbi:hypothetical protein [Congregibacter sp.]|uniref:hypothetical protein n=1 Tax=Congregibacter sp. TaxID=2744308 RepID=UPI003F6A89C0
MDRQRPIIGIFGIVFGATALLLAVMHFWAGSLSPQPPIETTVAEKAVAIKNATIAALKGEELEQVAPERSWDLDRVTTMATGLLAGLGFILGVVSYAMREPTRVAVGGVILGGAAMAFQFAVIAIGAIFLAILIAAVIGELGIE